MLPILLVLAYSLTAHAAIAAGRPDLALTTLSLIAAGAALRGFLRGGPWRPAAVLALAGGALAGAGDSGALSVLYALPVLINLALGLAFWSSLQAGRTPLITRIAELLGDPITPARSRYTRRVTLAWAVFFALMALTSALLAALAPPALWSLFANGVNYALVGLMFLAEYRLRGVLLDEPTRGGFVGFVRRLTRLDYAALLGKRQP